MAIAATVGDNATAGLAQDRRGAGQDGRKLPNGRSPGGPHPSNPARMSDRSVTWIGGADAAAGRLHSRNKRRSKRRPPWPLAMPGRLFNRPPGTTAGRRRPAETRRAAKPQARGAQCGAGQRRRRPLAGPKDRGGLRVPALNCLWRHGSTRATFLCMEVPVPFRFHGRVLVSLLLRSGD